MGHARGFGVTPETNKIHQGDVLEVIKTWPDGFVQTCVTSPPYWGLRDYGVDGQLGLEKTPEEFVAKMVEVFREVRRVLRDDGTCWVNLGDTYARDPGKGDRSKYLGLHKNISDGGCHVASQSRTLGGLKPKDLVGIPWRVAFALQADGWYLRSDIIWSKPNPMPESVTDRPTKAHEYLFLLSKSPKYFYDSDAIKEPAIYREDERPFGNAGGNRNGDEGRIFKPVFKDARHYDGKHGMKDLPETQEHIRVKRDKQRGHGRRHAGFNDRWDQMTKEEQCGAMKNKRSVWTVATNPYSEAHFATFPEKLIEPCVLAGAPAGGLVLDPFMGAGTTALVASKLNRKFIGIELNPKYIEMAEKRIAPELAQGKFA